jgi:Zn-finger protein
MGDKGIYKCEKCKDTGIIKDQSGAHTCWDCLIAGRLDNHSKKLPDNNIKL